MQFLNQNIQHKATQEYISTWAKNTRGLNNLMNTSKGRDKFCQLMQYTANLYVTCMKNSEEFADLVKQKKVLSVLRAKSIEDNLSNGRKIFRFLLFLNEFNELNEIIKNKKMGLGLKILKILSSICSFNYYFFDNIVWFTQIGIINKFLISHYKWKKFKDLFSLWKTILEIIISIYVVRLKKRKEQQIMEKLMKLYESQKIKPNAQLGHKYLDPIFVSICGLLQAFSVVFKSMKGKKKFYKLIVQDINEQGTIKDNTMILSQKEFEKRERSLSSSNIKMNSRKQSHMPSNAFIDDDETSHQTPPRSHMLNLPTISIDHDFGFQSEMKPESGNAGPNVCQDLEESEQYEQIDQKLIDDVYDVNAVKPNYELYSLKKNGILDYYKLISMQTD
eukprot:403347453